MFVALLLFLISSCYVYAQRKRLNNYSNIWIGLFILYVRSFFEIALWIYHFLSEDSNPQPNSYQLNKNDFSFLLEMVIVPILKKEIQSIKNFENDAFTWHPIQDGNELTFKRRVAPTDQDSLKQELVYNNSHIINCLNDAFLEQYNLKELPFISVRNLRLINKNLKLVLEISWGYQ